MGLALLILLGLLLAGCSGQTPGSPTATALPATLAPTREQTNPAATALPTSAGARRPLLIWLPPQFDPSANTPASQLLKARLDAFQAANPAGTVQVRIKAVTGPAGLLESLTAASAAAPNSLPALIALPRSDLEIAALKGLVFPLDGLTNLVDDADWYAYARQLALIQGSAYGLPFAGDAALLVYRPKQLPTPPLDWTALLRTNLSGAFTAADPQANLTLLLYLSAGGSVRDSQGRPMLQVDVLAKVLKLIGDGAKQGVFAPGIAQFQTDGQAWQYYRDLRAQWLVTWSSRYLSDIQADSLAASLPSLGQQPFTLASGWVWALSEPYSENRPAAVRLAEYLTASDFLAKFTAAAGYLPTRPTALAAWPDQAAKSVLSTVALSAQARPASDLLAILGPVLQDATLQVIKQQVDPTQAAQAAAERLLPPPTK